MRAGNVARLVPPPVPLDVVLAAIPGLPRPVLARLTMRLIERLDELDGDPDLEAHGDELDGTGGEDDFIDFSGSIGGWGGPGCPVADPGGGNVEDEGEHEDSL